jgi:hypothetical protein
LYGNAPRLEESVSAHRIYINTSANLKRLLDHIPAINVTSPELEIAWHDVVACLVEEAYPVVLARVPALRFFRPHASTLRHGESAGSLKLETLVCVTDMEADRGASWSSGQSIEDDEIGDVPWRRLDEGVARTVSWLRGWKGVGERAQGEDGAQDCEGVHVGLEVVAWVEVLAGLGCWVDLRVGVDRTEVLVENVGGIWCALVCFSVLCAK